jgi:hypothetical protein
MAAALVQVCVDPRLNHEVIRIQVRQKLERLGIGSPRIYVLNDVGGNPGHNLVNTLALLAKMGEPVALGAVLHHDDCLAARQGLRIPLHAAAAELAKAFAKAHVRAPVLTGQIRTEHNQVSWPDEPAYEYRSFTFGVPTPW